MTSSVQELVEQPPAYQHHTQAAYAYVRRHHSAEECCRRLKQLVDGLLTHRQRAA